MSIFQYLESQVPLFLIKNIVLNYQFLFIINDDKVKKISGIMINGTK